MISIIISSADKTQLHNIKKNIRNTIGIGHEILSYENEGARRGICEIYNQGIKAAKYDMLCFMHEDIEIRTNNWGKIVTDYFHNNPRLGLLGIAGSDSKSSVAGSWDSLYGTAYINIVQHFKHKDAPPLHITNPENPKSIINRVAWVDGVWFCCPKYVAREFPFDENLKGFHGYDIDFSLGIFEKYTVAVCHNILMAHFSEGRFSNDWLKAMLYISRKRKEQLPILLGPSATRIRILEKQAFRYLLRRYKKELDISFSTGLQILNLSRIREYGLPLYLKMCYSLVKIIVFNK